MILPKSLHTWFPLMALLPEEVAPALGQLAQKLNRWIGPLRQRQERGSGLPDGYDGLHHKGAYERLLMSEWALAETCPEEFNRRVCMNEQRFLRPKLQQKQQALKSIALFDMGPLQLGNPRIVQLALLMVFLYRANEAQCPFQWGVIQCPEAGLQACPAENFSAFVDQRCLQPVEATALAQWHNIITEGNIEDCWLITSAESATLTEQFVQTLWVDEVWHVVERTIQVDLQTQQQHRTLTLPLPSEADCSHLLRNPSRQPIPAKRTVSNRIVGTNVLFNDRGRHLMYRTEDGNLVLYAIPNSANATLGHAKRFQLPTGHFLLAAAVRKKGLSAITTELTGGRCDALYFHRIPAANCPNEVCISLSQRLPLQDSGQLHPFYFLKQPNGQLALFVCDEKKQLRKMIWNEAEKGFSTVEKNVIGIGQLTSGGLYYAHFDHHQQQTEVVCLQHGCAPVSYYYSVQSGRVLQAFCVNMTVASQGTVAIQIDPAHWHVFLDGGISGRHDTIFNIAEKESVIGIATTQFAQQLIVISADKTQINAVSGMDVTTLVHCPQKIASATVNPVRTELVYIDTQGELFVYSAELEAEVMHLVAEHNA